MLTRRTFIWNTGAAAAVVALRGSKGEGRMKAAPVAFPEDLVLRNPIADYYFKMKFHEKVDVRVEREHPYSLGGITICDVKNAVFLRGVSIRAKGPDALLDATTVSIALDGERIVERLPIRKAQTLGRKDFSLPETRTDLFHALTMERNLVGPFMTNGTRVNVDILAPEHFEAGGLDIEARLDTAVYVFGKDPQGCPIERYGFPWGWWDNA